MTTILSPEEYFGHRMGSDRQLARWDEITAYFGELARTSDRLFVQEVGRSTEGQPFLVVTISSPDNLARLEHFRQINLKLSDPRGLGRNQIEALVREGRAVVCQSMSLHGNEIGGTQMAPELAHDLITGDDPDTKRILDNVIFLMIPCFNPDGQVMVSDWYRKYLGTPYEGCPLPWLYHKYTGHDNNRDAVMLNVVESQHAAKVLYRDWIPQVYQDHHHMGSNGPRLYVAPYSEPIRPHADPLVWREIAWYGGHMTYLLEEEGKQGIISGARFAAWGHLGFHRLTYLHNIAGMLTESASAKLATPHYVHPDQLRGMDSKSMPQYEAQTNFPSPWPGGWWRLRDIVEQQKISAWAVLDLAARYREKVLVNAYRKAAHQTERGRAAGPYAYAIPAAGQNDPLTGLKLVNLLLDQGVTVNRLLAQATAGDRLLAAGSYLVPLAQPKMGVVRSLLEPTRYPDNWWTRRADGAPWVYDVSTDTVAEYMGVQVDTVTDLPSPAPSMEPVTATVKPVACEFVAGRPGYLLDGRLNDAFIAVNRLLDTGVAVYRVASPAPVGCGSELPPGSFYVAGGQNTDRICASAAAELGLSFCGVQAAPGPNAMAALFPRRRIGIYQGYWGGNMDEGWTRLVLDRFAFPYTVLRDGDFASPETLRAKADLVVLPSAPAWRVLGPHNASGANRSRAALEAAAGAAAAVPEGYRSGIGQVGLASLRGFVEGGGRLVAFDEAIALAAEALSLRVRDVVAGLDSKEFFAQGATLRVRIDNRSPLGYGMPEHALILNVNSPTLEVTDAFRAEDYRVVARYPQQDVLGSGWLIGEHRIAGKAALVSCTVGKGDAVLFGFRPQFRGQTHGTFKLLFNALV